MGTHRKALEDRAHRSAVSICRDGDLFTNVLATGDTFSEAAAKLSRVEGDR